MSGPFLSKGFFPHDLLQPAVNYILKTQLEDGCIPWFPSSYADPWDHTEAAMGLSIAGEYAAAEKAYQWLKSEQLKDGSWWIHYQDRTVKNDERRETNFVAYVATGVWHHYLITENYSFLCEMADMVEH
ncbi:MAG: prenyltransferase, partial [Cellvibrionales bacterium]